MVSLPIEFVTSCVCLAVSEHWTVPWATDTPGPGCRFLERVSSDSDAHYCYRHYVCLSYWRFTFKRFSPVYRNMLCTADILFHSQASRAKEGS